MEETPDTFNVAQSKFLTEASDNDLELAAEKLNPDFIIALIKN